MPKGRRVDELRLDLVRAVGCQTPVERPTVAAEQREWSVEGSSDVWLGASVLVGFRKARVIAIQATPDVARGERPVAVQLLPPDELHGIVIADSLWIPHTGNCLCGAVVPEIADDVRRVAHRIDRSDVLDGPVELFVNEPRRHRDVWSIWWSKPRVSSCIRIGSRSGSMLSNEGSKSTGTRA